MKSYLNISTILALALALQSCGGSDKTAAPPPPPPAAVNTIIVAEDAAAYYEEYPAVITALNEVELRPQVSGYITGIHFKDGQYVTKGQLLYSIDQQAYAANVHQAQANLEVAKANLNKAQKDADRYIELDKKDAIAKQVLDHSLADLESAKMAVKAAQANVNSVKTNLNYANIYAPFSGTIGISLVKLGAAVSPGATLLNTLSNNDPMAVDFFLDQKDLNKFLELEKKSKASNLDIFTLILADKTTYPVSGSIASIDRAVDATTGTIRVRLSFKNAENMLRPGMSATVRIFHDSDERSIVIPHKAVSEQMGEYFVYKVTDSSTVTQTKVLLGATVEGKAIVKEGLNVGEEIVVEGLQRVREGAKIQKGSK